MALSLLYFEKYNLSCPHCEGAAVKKRLNAKGLAVYESLVTLCLIGLFIGAVIIHSHQVQLAAQETAVRAALANIRMSIKLFKVFNDRNPKSLREMVEKKVMLPARVGSDRNYTGPIFFKESYLMEYAVDKEGNIVDAFGNPFGYDALKGEVRSTTKGYEDW